MKMSTHNKRKWFLSHKYHGSWHLCVVNCAISSITMYNMWCLLWHIIHKNYNLTLSNGTHYKIQPLAIERLSCNIFIIIVWYFARTCFKGSNIDSHQILTFFKILSLVISTITTSLLDSKCHLSELENLKYNKWNKSLNLVTIGKLNKTCTIRFVL